MTTLVGSRMSRIVPMLVPLALLSACTWLSDEDLAAQIQEVDDDGDGIRKADDCNDGDASIGPSLPETWYDGIDQACDGQDDYDQDFDGFVPSGYESLSTEGVDGSGALPGNDCDDTAPRVSPQQPDTWYDGVDQNCDGVDDYDQDGDGFVPDAYAGLATQYADGTGALPAGDCDDLDPAIRPSAQDTWYDGVDTDCDGADDYDKDGDGFVPDEWYLEHVEHGGTLANGDCNDDIARIFPGSDDSFYTGVDEDCGEDDDYDADGDGFVPDAYVGLPTEGVAGSGALPGGDCDDAEPLAFPGAQETLDDGLDADCEGTDGGVELDRLDGWTWTGAHDPVFRAADNRVYLSIAADTFNTGSTTTYAQSAVALYWSSGDVTDGRDGQIAWFANVGSPSFSLGEGQEFDATDSYLYGVVPLTFGTGTRGVRMIRYDVSRAAGSGPSSTSTDTLASFESVGFHRDASDILRAAACETSDGVLMYLQWDTTTSAVSVTAEVSDVYADRCGVQEVGGVPYVWVSDAGGLALYAFDPEDTEPVFTRSDWHAGYDIVDLAFPSGHAVDHVVLLDAAGTLAVLDDTGEVWSTPAPTAVAIDAHVDDAGEWFIVVLDVSGSVELLRGNAIDGFTASAVVSPFAAVDVAVYGHEDAVMIGVTGEDEVAVDTVAR